MTREKILNSKSFYSGLLPINIIKKKQNKTTMELSVYMTREAYLEYNKV